MRKTRRQICSSWRIARVLLLANFFVAHAQRDTCPADSEQRRRPAKQTRPDKVVVAAVVVSCCCWCCYRCRRQAALSMLGGPFLSLAFCLSRTTRCCRLCFARVSTKLRRGESRQKCTTSFAELMQTELTFQQV